MSEVEEKTNADMFREHSEGTNFDVATSRDTIKGWNDRRKSNNQIISGLVPFVQLIGLFDEKEYTRMFKTADKAVNVVFDEGGQKSDEYDKKFSAHPNFYDSIKEQIGQRFINLYIVKSVDDGLNVAPLQGVIMAEKVSQAHDAAGGIGITDLQVDYGKTNVVGSRKFNLRMSINDPKILDERFEYSKLATFGAQFLLIYGWSNPESIPGYDAAMSPPKLEDDPTSDSVPRRKRLIVPIRNLGNGGYWSAGRVNISKYDFGFNEMGKLEINVTLRDDATLGMSSTTMSSIAKQFKGFIDAGSLDTTIVSQSGDEFTLKDALNQRQIELNRHYNSIENATEEDYSEYISQWDMAVEHFSSIVTIEGVPINAADTAKDDDASPYWSDERIQEIKAETRRAQQGYPQQSALYIYKQIFATVLDDDPDSPGQQEWSTADGTTADDEGTVASLAPTKQVVTYEKRPAYYFLGALMDSASLCLASPRFGLGTSTVPSFFYRDVSPDSKLSTAFKSKLKSVNRATGMEERIQEAVIRLKERFLPPTPIEQPNPDRDASAHLGVYLDRASGTYFDELPVPGPQQRRRHELINRMATLRENLGQSTGNYDLRIELFGELTQFMSDYVGVGSIIVSGTSPVYEGKQTDNKTRVIAALFPSPPKISQLIGAPMRGFFIRVDTDDADYAETLRSKGLSGVGVVYVYLPDWKEEISFDSEGNEVVSSGSPDGFDPLNPIEYRAALPATSTGAPDWKSPFSVDFETRSQDPYGRGGRFYMVMVFKKDGIPWRLIVPYDVWRQSTPTTWNLLQKTWHNLYREYLAAYFERVIRLRVNELELLGIPIESIFNEPLDLDWMTGIIYNNSSFSSDKPWLKPFADVADASARDFDDVGIEDEIEKINQEAAVFEGIIAQNQEIIEGKVPPPITAFNYQLLRDPYYFDIFTGLTGAASRRVERINNLKIQIEQLTGGRYQRDPDGNFNTKDIMGNTIMWRFRNFSKVIVSDTLVERSPPIDTYKPEIEYARKPGTPIIKEEWVLWNTFDVPTDNYQNRFNVENNEWDDQLNKATNWKQARGQQYEYLVLPKIDNDKRSLREKINTIEILQDQLSEIYENYQESQTAIQNAEISIGEGQRKLTEFNEYFNAETGNVELSLYDDTSDFDGDGIYADVGRADDAHITTKVAQQWRRRFSGIVKRGVMDVANYVAPQGGKAFQLPTNNYQFTFDRTRRNWAVQGTPIRVLDPEFFLKIYNGSSQPDSILVEDDDGRPRMVTPDPEPIGPAQFDGIVKGLLKDLSHGINPTDATSQVISKDLEYAEVRIGHRTEKSYQNWSLFGNPGIPYENKNNKWGFRYGPAFERTLANDNVERLGGNYVKTYKDFLDLFGLGYNPNWPESLRIVGKWPTPDDTLAAIRPTSGGDGLPFPDNYREDWKDRPEHTGVGLTGNRLRLDDIDDAKWLTESVGMPMYTLIDGIGNILVDDGQGWYRPTGWYLDFAGKPIFLYPDRNTACQINNTGKPVNGVPPGHVIKMGGLTLGPGHDSVNPGNRNRPGAGWDDGKHARIDNDGNLSGRTKRFFQAAQDFAADYAKTQWKLVTSLFSGDFKVFLKARFAAFNANTPGLNLQYGESGLSLGLFMALRGNKTRYMNDGFPVDPYGTKAWQKGGPWGGRIGEGEHCMNLTLPMKQSLIHYRPSGEDKMTSLGSDIPGGDVTSSSPPYDGGHRGDPGKTSPPYSNTQYPYGTGWYDVDRLKDGSNVEQHGPYVFPERSKNWIDWSDFLQHLPGYGFLTQIDDTNYTSCVVQPSGQITDGREMNEGFVKFVIENVFAPLPKNRRCAARNNHQPIKIMSRGSSETREVKGYHENERLNDVTYADLFGPLRDPSENDEQEPAGAVLDPASYGNIDNFLIDNVKNIPIRAEVVNNLVNKNNTNMSIIQFFGEIFKPGAVGVNSGGNQHLACRQSEDGTFEVFAPSSINWREMSSKYAHLYGPAIGKEQEYKKSFPKDIIVLDFKAKDSLIESLDMNSTFDPITARAFRDAAYEFTGNSDALLHFMSYKDIAPDLLEFFKKEAPHIQDENNQAITIDDQGTVTLNRQLFMKDNVITDQVQNVISKFLQDNPARLNSMRALLLTYESSKSTADGDPTSVDNYATQLMANYMRKTTITIHGTTNISPMQKIIIKGIMPDLEGMYLITNTRESITPQGFQTILEGVLVRRPSDDARTNLDGLSVVPEENEQAARERFSYYRTEGTTVDGATADLE